MDYTKYSLKEFLSEMMRTDLKWSFSMDMAHAMMDWVNRNYPPNTRYGPNANIWYYDHSRLEGMSVKVAKHFDDNLYSYYVRINGGGPEIFLTEPSEHSMMHEFAHHMDDVFRLDGTSESKRRELNRAYSILTNNYNSMMTMDVIKEVITQYTSSREFIAREIVYRFLVSMGWDRHEAVYMAQIDMDKRKAERVFRLWNIEPDDGKISRIVGAWNRQLESRNLKELITFEYS
jgi:hypothetical protein